MYRFRRRFYRLKVALIVVVLIIIYYFQHESADASTDDKQGIDKSLDADDGHRENQQHGSRINHTGTPHLALAVCGNRLLEAWTMIKSAIMFSKSYLVIHIFSEKELQVELQQKLKSLPPDVRSKLEINIYDDSFPTDGCITCPGHAWNNFFRPCSSQRLFMADLLTDVDSIIYADIDTLFLAPVDELWSFFTKFNSTQIVAAVPITDKPHGGVYNSQRKYIPIIGPTGINAGLLLLNLTRLRKTTWVSSMAEILVEFEGRYLTGDQDLINIYLNRHPEQAYFLPCYWNYRIRSQCFVCRNAETIGAALLHAGTNSFITGRKDLQFKAVFSVFKQMLPSRRMLLYVGKGLARTS